MNISLEKQIELAALKGLSAANVAEIQFVSCVHALQRPEVRQLCTDLINSIDANPDRSLGLQLIALAPGRLTDLMDMMQKLGLMDLDRAMRNQTLFLEALLPAVEGEEKAALEAVLMSQPKKC
jgi:hypothetical protein